jgi:RHS repeat-associated protein
VLLAAKEKILSSLVPWCAETCISAHESEGKKPHQGVATQKLAHLLGHELSNSTTALGLRGQAALNRVGSRCTGKKRDIETGLDYFGARYYSNGLGRWVSADWSATPIPVPYADLTDPQTLNLYGYVRGLPTTKADIDGHGFWNKLGNALASDGCWCDDEGLQKNRAAVEKQRQQDAAKEQWDLVDSPSAKQWAKDHGGMSPRDALMMGMLAIGGAQAGYAYGPQAGPAPVVEEEGGVEVTISRSKSPASAQHIDDAQAAGHPETVTLDRSGAQGAARAAARGRAATGGTPTSPGMDRDEYPPKCCAQGGAGASVRSIPSGDNRSAGAQLGNQTRTLPDGTKITIKTGP